MTLLVIIYLSFISLGLPDAVLGAAWPMMYPDLGASVEAAGLINMVTALGTILSSLFSARILRKLGTGKLLVMSVIATALALTGYAFVRSAWMLMVLAVPLGLGAGAVDAALNSYVSLHYEAKHMSWLHSFWGLGASAGPMLMALTRGSWRLGYLIIAALQIGLSVILLRALPKWQDKGIEKNAAAERSPRYKDLLRVPGVLPALSAFFFYCAAEALMGLWSSSYLVLARGAPKADAAAFAGLFFAGITAGRMLSGFLAEKFSYQGMLRLGEGLILMGLLLLQLLPLFAAPFALFVVGLGCAPIYPLLIHRTPFHFGEAFSPYIIGLQMASAYTGTLLVPALFGQIAGDAYIAFLPAAALIMVLLMTGMTEKLRDVRAHTL
ncbi:MAG: MFS transporter [Clostridiales bacterium]|jgi:fucose permease|nr:MFS transporter [Clostridiales bacterium]